MKREKTTKLKGHSLWGGFILFLGTMLLLAACKAGEKEKGEESKNPRCKVEKSFFGMSPEGDSVMLYTLQNEQGLQVKITNFGGIITEIQTPDREGNMGNIVLGFDRLEDYLGGHPYFGAIIGRYANRIAGGSFELQGTRYELAKNNGNNALHGGIRGFDKVVWEPRVISCRERAALELSYLSPDGEEGYPGNLRTTVTYELLMDQFFITYEAECDQATVINLTNHSYFNLSAAGGTILDHVLFIAASSYTPVDAELIPTGELAPVEGSPFDFRKPQVIGSRLGDTGGDPVGYDHNFVLDPRTGDHRVIAKAMDPLSGRTLEVMTTEPGVQFYSGNFLDGSLESRGHRLEQYAGFCLETQHFPDSPNQEAFPSTVLHPDSSFVSQTIFRFGVEE